jgi:hypothetical protein
LNDTSYKKWEKIYFDSLSKIYPELLDPNYYKYLLDKSSSDKEKFEYSLQRIPIKKKRFLSLVNQINESEYWQLPFDNWCNHPPSDAGGFTLEVNTPKKYNVVFTLSCPADSTKYIKACQELVKYAKMDDEIKLIWDWEHLNEKVPVRESQVIDFKPEPKAKKKKAQ